MVVRALTSITHLNTRHIILIIWLHVRVKWLNMYSMVSNKMSTARHATEDMFVIISRNMFNKLVCCHSVIDHNVFDCLGISNAMSQHIREACNISTSHELKFERSNQSFTIINSKATWKDDVFGHSCHQKAWSMRSYVICFTIFELNIETKKYMVALIRHHRLAYVLNQRSDVKRWTWTMW